MFTNFSYISYFFHPRRVLIGYTDNHFFRIQRKGLRGPLTLPLHLFARMDDARRLHESRPAPEVGIIILACLAILM
jgi:hypothetical protein